MTRLSLILVAAASISIAAPLTAQDILISNFESASFAPWVTTGSAFGSGPSAGALDGQSPVTGFLGARFANSFHGGDQGTGTLTSLPFTIQRDYIRFLIGGGNQRGKTCLNLIVNGQIVRSATGMGDREALTWLQWNVSELVGSTAIIQVVDAATGAWGHINVDHILMTANSLDSVLNLKSRYLNLPVRTGLASRRLELVVDGLVAHEFFIELADTITPDFYAFIDLNELQGKQALVRVDSEAATAAQINALILSNGIVGTNTIYKETVRPIFHYTARRGWLNDPCGLVYHNGEYHLGYQHNPYGWGWANMHWGHAVSTDLVHWQELPEWLYPDPLGAMWSGSAVTDWNNSAGFGTNALIAFYTAAAKASDGNLPRMANSGRFTQCMAYSLDNGRTWTKYTNNPVLPNQVNDDRDPRVFWYAPGKKWVMLLWMDGDEYRFYSSTNLRNWSYTSTFMFPGVIEVPDIFELPLDGNGANKKWVFWGGAGNYYIGAFDGNAFTAQSGPFTIRRGNSFAATQTFNGIPGDARRILIVHGTAQYPGMPFNNQMNFPLALTLRTSPSGARLYANPVAELELLRVSTNTWAAQPLPSGVNIMQGMTGEAFELDASFQPGTASTIVFSLRGTTVTYDCAAKTLTCSGMTRALQPENGIVRLQILVDRGIIEIFGNDGLLYMPVKVTPSSGAQAVSLVASGTGAQLVSMKLHKLGSAWRSAPTLRVLMHPSPQNAYAGGLASFSVTASGESPIYYQWRRDRTNIPHATNSVLNLNPVLPSDAGDYDVIITSADESITSAMAELTLKNPVRLARWRMEAQDNIPNKDNNGTFPGVLDEQLGSGEGVAAVGVLPASWDHLITFNGAGGGVSLSTDVPPESLFVNGANGGAKSYNAQAIAAVDGALFFPEDQYGNEFRFTNSFSLELFFKTAGDRSGSGVMQLLMQGENQFRYALTLNEPEPGNVRFTLNDDAGSMPAVNLSERNYAGGQWHYLLAAYDRDAGTNGRLKLSIGNVDGSGQTILRDIQAGFQGLSQNMDGQANLFVGRNRFPVAQDHRSFLGLIDEVQISSGNVTAAQRLGRLPWDEPTTIESVSPSGSGVSIDWSAAAGASYEVLYANNIHGPWTVIGIVQVEDVTASFKDTDPVRRSSPVGFYRTRLL